MFDQRCRRWTNIKTTLSLTLMIETCLGSGSVSLLLTMTYINININYDIIHNILKSATKQHLTPKIDKFNKRRPKKSQWITKGIVNQFLIEINYISNTEQHLQIQMHAIELKLT